MENDEKALAASDEKVKKLLEAFLCLKYDYSNSELQEQIEEGGWEEKLNDWAAIKRVLTFKPTPMGGLAPYRGPKDRKPITVILPRDPTKNFEFLKAAAYFPWQVDPDPTYPDWPYDESIMIQLATATRYGMFVARSLIALSTEEMFPALPKTHRWCSVSSQQVNYNDNYYELELPPKYYGRKAIVNPISFDPDTDEKKTVAFFDYLFEIAKQGGKRPKEAAYK